MSQCTAHRKGGGECRGQAVSGTNVCRLHGGNAPQVRRRAAQRLLEASDSAAAYLVRTIEDDTKPDALRLAAARDLLDRAGLVGKERIEVAVAPAEEDKAPWELLLPKVMYVVDKPDDDTADATTTTGREQRQLQMGVVPPADSPAAQAMYEASRTAPDPEPPRNAVVRVDGPRPRVRRRRA